METYKDVKKRRQELGLSLKTLSILTGISSNTLDAGERRGSELSVKNKEVFDKAFNNYTQEVLQHEEIANNYLESRRKLKISTEAYKAPLVNVKAQAGYITSYDQTDYVDSLEKYALPPGISYHGAVWRYFEVAGKSMEPTFRSGDIILGTQVPQIDWNEIRNFYIYILVTGDQVMVKRLYKKDNSTWILLSDNEEEFPQKYFDPTTLKELWVFRRHIKRDAPVPKEFVIKL